MANFDNIDEAGKQIIRTKEYEFKINEDNYILKKPAHILTKQYTFI